MEATVLEMVERVQNGDRAAFGGIVKEFQGRLRMFVRMLLGSPERVDDLTQEVFITGYTRIDTYNPDRAEFYPWLKGIARKLAANENRRWKRQKGSREDYFADLRIEAASSSSPERETALETMIDRLHSCLERLPQKLQDLFREFYFHGRKLAEIASRENHSVGAVKMTLVRGRTTLKTCMENTATES